MIRKVIFFIILISSFFACKQNSSDPKISQTVSKDISVAEAAQLHSEGYVYIDLRTSEEIKNHGMIEGAISIDYRSSDFKEKIAKLPKSDKYIVYCASGGRSSKSLSEFEKYDLEAYNMIGGYGSWKKTQK